MHFFYIKLSHELFLKLQNMSRYFPGSTTGDKCQQPNSKKTKTKQNKEFMFLKWIFSKKVEVQVYQAEYLDLKNCWILEGGFFWILNFNSAVGLDCFLWLDEPEEEILRI